MADEPPDPPGRGRIGRARSRPLGRGLQPADRRASDCAPPARSLPRLGRRGPGAADGPSRSHVPAQAPPRCRRHCGTAHARRARAAGAAALRYPDHPARDARLRRRRAPVPAQEAPRPTRRPRRELRNEDRDLGAPVPAAGRAEAGRRRRPAHGEAALLTARVRVAATRKRPGPHRAVRLRAHRDRLLVEDLRRRRASRPGRRPLGVRLQQLARVGRRRARRHAGHPVDMELRGDGARRATNPSHGERQRPRRRRLSAPASARVPRGRPARPRRLRAGPTLRPAQGPASRDSAVRGRSARAQSPRSRR